MNEIPFLADHAQLSFRWIHFVAGVLWIGLLFFFNWVNGPFAATMDAETKKKVVPELMPRALFFFRWGAAYTWLTGVVLMFLLYYMGPYLMQDGVKPTLQEWVIPFALVLASFPIFDLLFKTLGAKQIQLATILWGAITVVLAWVLGSGLGLSGRAVVIHIGAFYGTTMAANVWMRIWPAQRRIITAIKAGQAPNPADPALAGARSKQNTYMSISLLLFMVAVHQERFIGADNLWLWIAATLVLGFAATFAVYKKASQVKGF